MKIAPIPTEHIPALRMRLAISEQKRIELAAMQFEMQAFVARATGVDLEHETWELDEARWMLVQREEEEHAATEDAPPVTAVAPVSARAQE